MQWAARASRRPRWPTRTPPSTSPAREKKGASRQRRRGASRWFLPKVQWSTMTPLPRSTPRSRTRTPRPPWTTSRWMNRRRETPLQRRCATRRLGRTRSKYSRAKSTTTRAPRTRPRERTTLRWKRSSAPRKYAAPRSRRLRRAQTISPTKWLQSPPSGRRRGRASSPQTSARRDGSTPTPASASQSGWPCSASASCAPSAAIVPRSRRAAASTSNSATRSPRSSPPQRAGPSRRRSCASAPSSASPSSRARTCPSR
mmetsp:Transcript_3132/g.9456  ORF Transcript_3132/g.9456 Transcript_3132/m.9456 type:complete len:257 (-) Transcript_3132:285-1055(-)